MSLKITVSGGIPVKARKKAEGGAVGTVVEVLKSGQEVFVRDSQEAGLVTFKVTGDCEVKAWVYANSAAILPVTKEEECQYPWAEQLIAHVKRGFA